MKAGWETKTLGELCSIQMGATPPRANASYFDPVKATTNVWLSIADISASGGRTIASSREHLSALGAARVRVVEAGTLLVSFKLSIGKLAFAGCDLRTNEAIAALTIRNDSQLDQEYLYWALRHFDWDSAAEADQKVKGRTLNKDKLTRIPVSLPTYLAEQRRIVEVLDEAFAGLATATANAEQTLANYRELFRSYLDDVFRRSEPDWIEEPISKAVRFVDYRGRTPTKAETGVRLITAKNVKMGYVQRQPEEFVEPGIYDKWMVRGIPRRGDVLFTTEAPLGNVAQLDTDEQVVIGQRLITMQPDPEKLHTTFLKFMLLSAPLQELILRKATGATVQGIKASLLKLIPVRYPEHLDQQVRITDQLEEIESEVARASQLQRQKLALLTELKASLLNRAFSGELV